MSRQANSQERYHTHFQTQLHEFRKICTTGAIRLKGDTLESWKNHFPQFEILLSAAMSTYHVTLEEVLKQTKDTWVQKFSELALEEEKEVITESEARKLWALTDPIVHLFLIKSLPDSFLQSNANFTHLTAKMKKDGKSITLWSAIIKQLSPDNSIDRVNKLQELVTMRQQEFTSVSLETHYAKFFGLYANMIGRDKDGLSARNASDLFIGSLHPGMRPLRSSILTAEPPMSIDKQMDVMRAFLLEQEKTSELTTQIAGLSMAHPPPKGPKHHFKSSQGRKEACRNFQKGTCYRGESCKYDHIVVGSPETAATKPNRAAERRRETENSMFVAEDDDDQVEEALSILEFANQVFDVNHQSFILDSGCSRTILSSTYANYVIEEKSITPLAFAPAWGENSTATKMGTFKFGPLTIEKVAVIPNARCNLISLSDLRKLGCILICKEDKFSISLHGKCIFTGSEQCGVLVFDTIPGLKPAEFGYLVKSFIDPQTQLREYHHRFAHIGTAKLHQLMSETSLRGIPKPLFRPTDKIDCLSCSIGGSKHKNVYDIPQVSTALFLEKWYVDVHHIPTLRNSEGLLVPVVRNFRYVLQIVDDATRYGIAIPFGNLSEVPDILKNIITINENSAHRTLKILKSDRGSEFLSRDFIFWMARKGISFETCPPSNHNENGIVERRIGVISRMARISLQHAGLHPRYYTDAYTNANFVLNNIPSKSIENNIPQSLAFDKDAQTAKIQSFGCRVVLHDPHAPKGQKGLSGVNLGYEKSSNCWKILMDETNSIRRSKDVTFHNSIFPFSSPKTNPEVLLQPHVEISDDPVIAPIQGIPIADPDPPQQMEIPLIEEQEFHPLPVADPLVANEIPLRRSTRETHRPDRGPMVYNATPVRVGTTPVMSVIINNHTDEDTKKLAADGRQKELDMLLSKGTFTLEYASPPKTAKILQTKFVYAKKKAEDGTPSIKARLVAMGNFQRPGIDYAAIYSPVIGLSSLRLCLAIAAKRKLRIHQFDVQSAYLNADLQEELYIRVPEGLPGHAEKKILRLKKNLYGLKQGGKNWYIKFAATLEELGYKRTQGEHCIYYKIKSNGLTTLIPLYVDDYIACSNDLAEVERLYASLNTKFGVRKVKSGKFLGMRITQTDTGITLDQSEYVEQMLYSFDMLDSHPLATPLIPRVFGTKLSPAEATPLDYNEITVFKQALGALLYAANGTRPDISHAIGVIARASAAPVVADWVRIKRVFRYLQGTRGKGLVFTADSNLHINGFVDASFGGQLEDARSTTGFLLLLGSSIFHWGSKKQVLVATSSTEAEISALMKICGEVEFYQNLFTELCPDLKSSPVQIFCDNKPAVEIANGARGAARTMLYGIRYGSVQEAVKRKIVSVTHIPGAENTADVFTKPLERILFAKFTSRFLANIAL